MDAEREAVLPTFLGEAEECLGAIEQQVLVLDRARTHGEAEAAVAEIFRAAHTLKGNS
jgi:chemotaxis protein histidine kinase CheA